MDADEITTTGSRPHTPDENSTDSILECENASNATAIPPTRPDTAYLSLLYDQPRDDSLRRRRNIPALSLRCDDKTHTALCGAAGEKAAHFIWDTSLGLKRVGARNNEELKTLASDYMKREVDDFNEWTAASGVALCFLPEDQSQTNHEDRSVADICEMVKTRELARNRALRATASSNTSGPK